MSSGPSQVNIQSFPAVGCQSVVKSETDLNGFSIDSIQHGLTTATQPASQNIIEAAEFPNFSIQYQDSQMMALEDHGADLFALSGRASISSMGGERKDSIASAAHSANLVMADQSQRRQSLEVSDEASPEESNHQGTNALDDNMSDEFGLSSNAPGDGTDLGGKPKESKSENAPAWSELKTKAGKERKRLPLACIACRRKKIRCSGEKPACKHCLRSRIPCVYKVTTRKAAPRTDYMAMLDKRLKRMEDRIIKIIPKPEQEASTENIMRAVVKPAIPGSLPSGKSATKKRAAEEAFGADLEKWARRPAKASMGDSSGRPTSLQVQEREDSKLLTEGREALPPMEMREHLADIFFEAIYGQAYHLLHKPSYMRKLKMDTLPPVLVLSVCAVSARFSSHPTFANIPNFLRGEEWAVHARDIVTRRYEWPNITILTCLLILGLHEFGTCHGGRSWALGGQAIRMAFALQLHKDLEYDPTRPSPAGQLSFIDREIRRRTMWACFLMDRFNSSGTDRPMFVKEETVRIQLPIKEKLFQLDMPGPTEDLDGKVPHPVPKDEGQQSSAKDNMGVAAYMVRSIALWGKIINYLNQGGKEADPRAMWDSESEYMKLLKQAKDFAEGLPDGLKYTGENLRLHDTERMANQFLFLHISVQQNILFMNRFAVSSPAGRSQADVKVPSGFMTEAGAKAFAAANRISELLKDAESYFIAAPFVGYCAFLAGTVHIFGMFSGNAAMESACNKKLGTCVKFLQKMKRYWGMFHFMFENLQEQYRTCADAARQGTPATESATASPIFQYGDWFDRYPHGVSQSDFLDPANAKKKETGDDGVLEQKPETYTVEDFFTQLSPPQSAEGRENTSVNANTRPNMAKRTKSTTLGNKKQGPVLSQHLEPLRTDINPNSLPEHIQQRIQQHQRQQFAHTLSHIPHSQNAGAPNNVSGAYAQQHAAPSPISPVTVGHGHGHQFGPHAQQPHSAHARHHAGTFYNPDLLSLGLANSPMGLLPQLDRQLVFGAYGGSMDPTAISGPEALMDWDALAGNTHHSVNSHHPDHAAATGLGGEPSSAWFMPFNMEPPDVGHEVGPAGIGVDAFGGMFTQGMGLRRGSHH